ncbi:MAG: GAF domain-containing protein [Elusimicrobiaceae bacterium]|nr:GAF domain-containing protein [Elusimicrobiaceae bacterium]
MEQHNCKNISAFELLNLACNLHSIMDLDFLLQKIGQYAEEMLDCEASSIMLLDERKENLLFKIATGAKGSAMKKMTVPVGQGIAGWVAQEKKPVVVNDTRSDPRFAAQYDKASGFITRQLLAVPMMNKDEIIGVAEVLNRRGDHPFSDEDIAMLTSLAGLASVAIANTRLIQEQKNFFSHVLEIMAASIEISAPDMDSHPTHCAYLCCALAKRLGIADPEYRNLYYAGLLHDMGYIGLRNKRLMQESGIPGYLPPEEACVAMSIRMMEGIHIFKGSIDIVRHHRENFDGTGFPDGLTGETIPTGARILRLVNAAEHLRRTARLSGQDLRTAAIEMTRNGSGTLFDPVIGREFIELLEEQDHIWEL